MRPVHLTPVISSLLRSSGSLTASPLCFHHRPAAAQVNSRTLLLPPRSLAAGAVSRFGFRACYANAPEQALCGAAQAQFVAVQSPLARKQSRVIPVTA